MKSNQFQLFIFVYIAYVLKIKFATHKKDLIFEEKFKFKQKFKKKEKCGIYTTTKKIGKESKKKNMVRALVEHS